MIEHCNSSYIVLMKHALSPSSSSLLLLLAYLLTNCLRHHVSRKKRLRVTLVNYSQNCFLLFRMFNIKFAKNNSPAENEEASSDDHGWKQHGDGDDRRKRRSCEPCHTLTWLIFVYVKTFTNTTKITFKINRFCLPRSRHFYSDVDGWHISYHGRERVAELEA